MGIKIKTVGKVMLPTIIIVAALALALMFSPLLFGVNKLGERTVIEYPWGGKAIKFNNGWYFQGLGSVYEYGDYMTFDFSKLDAGKNASIDTKGIPVRYRDGGTGTIHGKARYGLPNDFDGMMKLHKAFKSHRGVASKLVLPVTEEAMNLTAGLLTSEGAYAEQRGTFLQWANSQIKNGKFKTEMQREIVKDAATGMSVSKNLPVPSLTEGGAFIHMESDLKDYGITLAGLQITDWNFEKKTLTQIADKRKATMAIITAKANAEKAKQDAVTAEETGKANVMTAKYAMEVEKQKAVTNAERVKEVAEIKAQQMVEVARQAKLEAEEYKAMQAILKDANILEGEGLAEKKRLILEADGALEQKLKAVVAINAEYAQAMGQQKWVPEINMGSEGDITGSAATDLISLLSVQAAKSVAVDLQIKE